jgi:predicted ATPase
MAYAACCLWCLGYPDQAARQSQKALDLARELDHPLTLIDVLAYGGCLFNVMRRDAQALNNCASKMKRLASEKVPAWLAEATQFRGEALAMTGHLEEGIAQMQEGLEIGQLGADRCFRSGCFCSLAEAQARMGRPEEALATLTEALALLEKSDERYWEAELHRVRGKLLLTTRGEAEAEASLYQALEVARRQKAKSWELRVTIDLARLWRDQGRTDEAGHLLQQTYNWFTEGFDTADLREAKTLLEELSR